VIVAVPSATEVTRPVLDTAATAVSDVVHVTVALAIIAPFWSLTVADSWAVAPSEARLRLVTERVIDVATAVGVGAVGVLSPPQLHNSTTTAKTTRHPTQLFYSCPHSAPPPSGPELRTSEMAPRVRRHERPSSRPA